MSKRKHHITWAAVCLLLLGLGGVVSTTLYYKFLKSTESAQELNIKYQALYNSSDEMKLTRMIVELQPKIDHLQLIEYRRAIMTSSQKWGVPPLLVAAMVMRESSYNPKKLGSRLPSGTRCMGPMQVHPVVHKDKLKARNAKASDLMDIAVNVDVGSEILKEFLNRYNGNVRRALMGYVGGKHQGYVDDVVNAFVAYS